MGVDVDVAQLEIAQPRLSADEPAFDAFWAAVQERTPLAFDYLRSGQPAPATRHLQPWGVARYSGRWYAVGYDSDREAERVFRLSRVQGEVRRDGAPGSYEIPAGTDVRDIARRLAPARITERVVVLARAGAAVPLRRAADTIDEDVDGPDTASALGQARADPRRHRHGATRCSATARSSTSRSPQKLRDHVVARLRGVGA